MKRAAMGCGICGRRTSLLLAAAVVAAMGSTSWSHAAEMTWSADAAGNWSDTTKWLDQTPADGAGNTGNLTCNISAARTITVNTTSRTLGILNIGDTDATASYTLNASGGASLILDNTPNSASAQINQSSTSSGDIISAPITLNSSLDITNNSATKGLTISSPITGSQAINVAGGSNVTLSGANTALAGNITIKSGTLSAGSTSALGSGTIYLGDVSGSAGATLVNNSASTISNPIVVNSGSGARRIETFGGKTISGTITLNNDLTLAGGTGVVLTTSNTISGTGDLTFNFTDTGYGQINGSAISNVGKINFTGSSSKQTVVNSAVSNTTGIVVDDSNANGSILFKNSISVGSEGLTIENNGAASFQQQPGTASGLINGTGNLTLSANSTGTIQLISYSSRAVNVNKIINNGTGTGTVTIQQPSSDPLQQDSATSLLVLNTNIYAGNLAINAGAVEATNPTNGNATGYLSGNLLLDGGVLQGARSTGSTFTQSLGTAGSRVQFGANGGGFAAKTGTMTVKINNNTGTLVWGSTTSFLGDNAPLIFGSSSANALVDFQNGIDLNGKARTINVIAGAGGDVAQISGVISGTGGGSLVKTGAGILKLTNSNTYTGSTTIQDGTLALSGAVSLTSNQIIVGDTAAHSSAIFDVSDVTGGYTLASGRTLSGYGTIVGNVTNNGALSGTVRVNGAIGGSGLLSPGNSPGIQTVGQLDPSAGQSYAFEFTHAASPNYGNAAASLNDVLRITDATNPFTGNLTSANAVNIYFDVASLAGGDSFKGGWYTDNNASFTTAIAGGTFNYYVRTTGAGDVTFNGVNYLTLAHYDPSVSVSFSTVSEVANFGSGNVNGYVTDFVVTIPEPATIGVMIGAAGMGLMGRRRRA